MDRVIAVHPRVVQVAEAVERFCDDHGYSPSLREIGEIVGLSSSNTILVHVNRAVEVGLLTQETRQTRSLRPVRDRCSHGRP